SCVALAGSRDMWYAKPQHRPTTHFHRRVSTAMADDILAHPGDTIAIASDHAGVELKSAIAKDLAAGGYKVLDLGTATTDSVDYPDYGHALARALTDHKAKAGVAICGTGIGISIAANRHPGVRAALVSDDETAK